MKRSYLDYAMSVIVARALPEDVYKRQVPIAYEMELEVARGDRDRVGWMNLDGGMDRLDRTTGQPVPPQNGIRCQRLQRDEGPFGGVPVPHLPLEVAGIDRRGTPHTGIVDVLVVTGALDLLLPLEHLDLTVQPKRSLGDDRPIHATCRTADLRLAGKVDDRAVGQGLGSIGRHDDGAALDIGEDPAHMTVLPLAIQDEPSRQHGRACRDEQRDDTPRFQFGYPFNRDCDKYAETP